jgi:hypothetical protein
MTFYSLSASGVSASRGVPQMLPHTAQHHRTTGSLSLIFVARRAPHRVHGGGGDRASVSDMATGERANCSPRIANCHI